MKERKNKRLDILIALIAQDRQEIREIKNSIFNLIILFVTSSFALTAYLKDNNKLNCRIDWISKADWFILFFMILYAIIRYNDLINTRRCLKMRQDMLLDIETGKTVKFKPFKSARNYPIDIKDKDTLIKISFGILIIIIKMIWLKIILP